MPDGSAIRYVALFRALNVGGHGKVDMADLLAMARTLDLATPCTVLQSGNLVFAAPAEDTSVLEAELEAGVARLGVSSEVMVRSADEWARAVAGSPFRAKILDDPAHVVLLALKNAAAPGAEAALAAAVKGRERAVVAGRVAYLHYPDGIGRSKLTMPMLERHLGTRATGRNWRTVAKIAALLAARAGLSA